MQLHLLVSVLAGIAAYGAEGATVEPDNHPLAAGNMAIGFAHSGVTGNIDDGGPRL
jgi:hypothetical protein